MEREPKDVLKSYESSLEDLTFNSKPIINMLTMTADKYTAQAPEIVELIESRVLKVRAEYKLPAIYLMDSIMKNLGGEYLQLFSRNIVRIFCHAFESLVDPKVRISLYKLRQTWTPFIPVKKLAAIDKHVNAIDPNWPITAKGDSDGPTIFVNPDFLKKSKSSVMEKQARSSQTFSPKKESLKKSHSDTTAGVSVTLKSSSSVGLEVPSEEQSIQDKRRQLLEQQRQKKMDTKIAMGLAPPVEEVKKRQRSHSPNPPSSQRKSPQHHVRPRSASPTVLSGTAKPHQDSERGENTDSIGPDERKHLHAESSTEKPTQKRRKLDDSSSLGDSIETAVLKPIRQEMLELDDLPPELLEKHKDYILKQAKTKLESGQLTKVQHESLVGQINELYSLQKKRIEQDKGKSLSVPAQPCPHSQSQPCLSVQHQQPPLPQPPLSHPSFHPDEPHPPFHPDESHPPFHPDESHPPFHSDESHPPFHPDEPHHSFRQDQLRPPFDRPRSPHQLSRKQPLLPRPVYNEPQPPPPKSYPDKHMHPSYRSRSPPIPPRPSSPSHNVPVSYQSHDPMYHPQKFDNDFSTPRVHRAHVPPPHDYPPPPPPPHRHHPYREQRPPSERPFARGRPVHRRGRSKGGPPSSGIHGGYLPPRPPVSRGRGRKPVSTLPVKDLFDKLVKSGILPGSKKQPVDTNHSQSPLPNLPEISLTNSDLRQRHSSLVDLLHRGESCTSCGQRFLPEQHELYQKHLDWHYQENRMDKDGTKRTFRNWYLHPDDWISFEELSSGVPNEPVLSLESESKEVQAVAADEEVVSCRVLPGEGNEVCTTCEEVLEQFWEEDEEEWHFKEAVRSPGGQVYHVYCYEDSSVVKANYSQDTKTEEETAADSTST